MSKMIVERFEYYGKTIDESIHEIMEINRNITYNFNAILVEFEKIKEIIKIFEGTDVGQFTEIIKQLTERVTKLEEQIKNLGTGGGTTYDDTEIRNLINNLKTLIEALDTRVTTIEGDITTIKEQITKIETKITQIEGDITNINTRISSIENVGLTLSKKIENIENVIKTIQGNITKIEGDITTINEQITNIKNEVLQIKEKPVKITAGENVVVNFDEPNNSYSISATGGGGTTTITQELKYSNFTLTKNQ